MFSPLAVGEKGMAPKPVDRGKEPMRDNFCGDRGQTY